jgi:hypothetical protein
MRMPFPLDSMADRAACAARAGCHSDSGFAHTERNFYAQMIYGESFEFGNQSSWHYIYPAWDPSPTAATLGGLKWNSAVDATAKATIGYDQAEAHHGYASLKLDYTSGSGTAGVTNRGIGNEGLFLKSGLEYEGYFFALARLEPYMLGYCILSSKARTRCADPVPMTLHAMPTFLRMRF